MATGGFCGMGVRQALRRWARELSRPRPWASSASRPLQPPAQASVSAERRVPPGSTPMVVALGIGPDRKIGRTGEMKALLIVFLIIGTYLSLLSGARRR